MWEHYGIKKTTNKKTISWDSLWIVKCSTLFLSHPFTLATRHSLRFSLQLALVPLSARVCLKVLHLRKWDFHVFLITKRVEVLYKIPWIVKVSKCWVSGELTLLTTQYRAACRWVISESSGLCLTVTIPLYAPALTLGCKLARLGGIAAPRPHFPYLWFQIKKHSAGWLHDTAYIAENIVCVLVMCFFACKTRSPHNIPNRFLRIVLSKYGYKHVFM